MEFLKYFEILKVYLSYVRKKHFRQNTSFQLNTEDTGVYFVVGFWNNRICGSVIPDNCKLLI